MRIAFVCHPGNGTHIVGTKVCVEAALTYDLAVNFFFGILTGETHFNQCTGRNRTCSFGRECTVAVKGVEYIYYTAADMCAYGNTSAHMDNNQS